MAKIGVVLVTYNRLEKLKKALDCFDKQTTHSTYVLVVDNASTDGTGDFLKEWRVINSKYEKIVVTMDSNTGGSGGFHKGLQEAQNMDSDWIWVSDDDAYPECEAIEKASNYLDNLGDQIDKVSAICGAVYYHGKIDRNHRKDIFASGRKIIRKAHSYEEYKKDCFELNAFSYVGTIINKEKLMQVGLPNKDYFIWFDDTEHSLRLSKVGKIICLPYIRIDHDATNGKEDLNWKTYYGLRNEWDMWRKHFPTYIFWLDVLLTKYRIFTRKLRNHRLEETLLTEAALNDVLAGKFGIHDVYKPGWKVNDKNGK